MENKTIKILAIDDNRDNLVSIRALITEAFPQSIVYSEESGPKGIESARRNDPDVVLLDIVMPDMDGFEVCRILKADTQLSETPVIFLTALKGNKESHIQALEAGGDAFLAKPVDSSELIAQINAMLKIKEAVVFKKNEKLRLEELVQQRTEELKKSNIAALNLLEDLNAENELRKQHEWDLKKSEEKFRTIFQDHSAVKLIIDPDNGNILEANNAAAAFYGWSVKTLQEMNIHQISARQSEVIRKEINKSRNSVNIHVEYSHSRADGSQVDVEVFSSRIMIGEKEFLHMIIHDISEKKKAEEKLKLLNRAIEASSVSVVITDSEGKINYVNPYFTSVTGYTYEEILGENPRILKSGNQNNSFYEELWSTIHSGKDWTGEFQNRKKNGEMYWEAAIISPIKNSKGELTNYIAIKEDITQRKKLLEELVLAKEKAEESDKLKTAFINNISHEIRTPLNGILGFGQLMAEFDHPVEERKLMLKELRASSDRLLNTVSDYMEIAMIVSGTMQVKKEDFLLETVYSGIVDKTRYLCAGKSIEFESVTPSESAGLTITTDPTLLKKILNKLIDNALKFTHDGKISCGYKIEVDHIAFFVRDTGIGINSDKLDYIFEMFSQEDASLTRGHEGNGLGLTIAKGLVTLLGGQIHVLSEKGIGSEFILTIPCKTSTLIKQKNSSETRINKVKPLQQLVLVAEDDELNFMFMQTVLNSAGYNYIHAANGLEAVNQCRQNPAITIVLMDIKMPLMNGMEATKLIHEFRPELPVIATTAYAQLGDEQRFLDAGCSDYITKPIGKERILSVIKKYSE